MDERKCRAHVVRPPRDRAPCHRLHRQVKVPESCTSCWHVHRLSRRSQYDDRCHSSRIFALAVSAANQFCPLVNPTPPDIGTLPSSRSPQSALDALRTDLGRPCSSHTSTFFFHSPFDCPFSCLCHGAA